jgi:hypothetical protein
MQASRAASISLSVRTTLERTRERIALFRIGRREREPTANRVPRPRFARDESLGWARVACPLRMRKQERRRGDNVSSGLAFLGAGRAG